MNQISPIDQQIITSLREMREQFGNQLISLERQTAGMSVKIDNLTDQAKGVHILLTGNGDPEHGVLSRLAAVEDDLEDVKEKSNRRLGYMVAAVTATCATAGSWLWEHLPFVHK